jgi:hypothetical protein
MDRIYFGIRMSAASTADKELKRLQIELLPFEDPVATLLRSVPDDAHRAVAKTLGEGERLSHLLTHENSNEAWVWQRAISYAKKSRRVWDPAALISVVPKLTFRLSLREPRDRSYADRQCLRNRHARERRI